MPSAAGPKPPSRMGIPVHWVLVSTYVISGACAGIGAVILAGRTDAGSPLFGNLLELDTIAAVIIGGASFLGGRGHLGHAVIGAIMIGVIRNALNLLNVDIFFQLIVIGVVIVDRGRVRRAAQPSRRPRARRPGREGIMSAAAPHADTQPSTDASGALGARRHQALRLGAGARRRQPRGADAAKSSALLGDNGAGKSTLIKCISGVHQLDAGAIHLDGLRQRQSDRLPMRASPASRPSTRTSRCSTI